MLESTDSAKDESAIRVDQYMVVFIKFVSSVTLTIEHDFTMSIQQFVL